MQSRNRLTELRSMSDPAHPPSPRAISKASEVGDDIPMNNPMPARSAISGRVNSLEGSWRMVQNQRAEPPRWGSDAMRHDLFTLGHSTMDPTAFLAVLHGHAVSLVVDVRSQPRSSHFPHFDITELDNLLRSEKIRYLFLGEELGGRPEDPRLYRSNGVVDYRACRKSRQFLAGIDRVLLELEKCDLALLCAEDDPINCHRFLMICPELLPLGVVPGHIRKNGMLESQREAEDRLLQVSGLNAVSGESLFSFDRAAALEDAYLVQSEKRAFRVDPRVLEPW